MTSVTSLRIFANKRADKFLPNRQGGASWESFAKKTVMVRDSNVQGQVASSRAALLLEVDRLGITVERGLAGWFGGLRSMFLE